MYAWAVVTSGTPLERIEMPTPEPTGTDVLIEVTRLANEGMLAPLPVTLMPTEEANLAMNRLRDGRVTGRIILMAAGPA